MLEIQRATPPDQIGPVSDRRLCLTKDKSRVVEENDPEAATLLVGAGCILPAAEAEKYGLQLVNGKLVIPSAVAEEAAAPAGVLHAGDLPVHSLNESGWPPAGSGQDQGE